MELIDTHIHLDFEQYDTDREELIQRAHAQSVTRILSIGAGGGIESTRKAIAIAKQYPSVWASAGVHPQDAGQTVSEEELRVFAADPRVIAIGETGLDFFRDWSPRELQYQWFKFQIELAKELKKPLIIHSRDAGEECLKLLRERNAKDVRGVFHCYSENAQFAERLREIGFLVSFTGSITFKKADALRAIVKDIPLTQIMVETDGPYMAPEPYRGKRSESVHVVEVAKTIASIKAVSFEEVCAVTTQNALSLFGFV